MKNIFVILVYTLIIILCLEVGLTIKRPNIPVYQSILKGKPYPAEYSTYLPFTLPKGQTIKVGDVYYKINKYGFRGPEVLPPDETSSKRVVILGDSYTFGWGVNEKNTYPYQLQQQLNKNNISLDVINSGYHAGYSPDSYYAALVEEYDYLKPDFIIVALCMNNDITDIGSNHWDEVDKMGFPTKISTVRNYMDFDGNSLLLKKKNFPLWIFNIPILRESRFFVALNLLYYKLSGNKKYRIFDQQNRIINHELRFKKSLKGIKIFAEERNINLLYMVIPTYFKWRRKGIQDADIAVDYIKNQLFSKYIDLRKVYEKEEDQEKLFIPNDGHFSEYGNKRISEELLPFLMGK